MERYRAIENFIPESFWKIKVTHMKKGDLKCEFTWDRGRLFDHLCAEVIHEVCVFALTWIEGMRSTYYSGWNDLKMFERLLQ